MDTTAAWVAGLITMALVLLYVYHRTGDLRRAFMASLLWGKILSGTYWLLGIDYTIAYLYYYTGGHITRIAEVTAAKAIFASFLLTNIAIYYWPRITRELRLAKQELPGVPE